MLRQCGQTARWARTLSAVRRQYVLDEGDELICVWVLPGLNEIAHICWMRG